MNFWEHLLSKDNSVVNTPSVILMVMGTIIMLESMILIIYHCFYHGKGIDDQTVRLILGLLGGGVLNAGASYYSKTTMSQVTGFNALGEQPYVPPGPPPAKAPPPP